VVCGFIGSGNHASRTLIPAFKRTEAILDTLVSSGGISSSIFGKRHNFANISTDINSSIEDNMINTIVISTTHNLHASQVIQGIKSNKNIFVEKPLALTLSELDDIDHHYYKEDFKSIIMVGFNRRFSPHIKKMKKLLKSTVSPMSIVMTINAGAVPADNWLQNKDIGGGRVIGEVCHFIDLMRFLIGSNIKEHSSTMLGMSSSFKIRDDKVAITLSFEDGSFGVINYLANGGKAFPKERIEVFCDDAVLQLNNFRELKGYGWKNFKKYTTWSQNKGQNECANAFVKSILNGESSPIPYEEIIEISRVTIEIANSLADSNK
jgi:predicted dehydrogenase